MKKTILPYLAKTISSDAVLNGKRQMLEVKRKTLRRPHRVDVFIRVDDPYSYLLIQVFEDFLARYAVVAHFHTNLDLQADMYPAQAMWYEQAAKDAFYLGNLYGLEFPRHAKPLEQKQVLAATQILLEAEDKPSYVSEAKRVLRSLWFDKAISPSSQSTTEVENTALNKKLHANDTLLKKMGHYFGAMIHYEGEWYWGIDRLDHLESRLNQLGLAHDESDKIVFNKTYRPFCQGRPESVRDRALPLTLYWSARSPYSYIALERTITLTHHYQIPLIIKPVMPMMMRGMFVPDTKKMYIFHDTKREAKKLGLAYGFLADPLGDAVKRCYAVLDYAKEMNKTEEFLLSFARGVNAQGIRAETDRGLKLIVERCGLEWKEAESFLSNSSWQQWTKDNVNEMMSLGCWGVPSFHYGELTLWGQDRLGIIENMILGK